MIQRFLYTALVDGLAQFTSDPTLLEQLFSELYCLSDEEVAGIKQYYAANPPRVMHAFAPRDAKPPLYSIVLQDEGEDEVFLNNDGLQIEDESDPDFGADVKTSIWRHSYHVITQTEHPDVTGYYYEIAKSIFLASNDYFTEQGLFEIRITGTDLSPALAYVPEHLFGRTMNFGCQREFQRVDRDSKTGKAFQVGGIHINDDSESSSDVGGVKTLVDVISPEDLD